MLGGVRAPGPPSSTALGQRASIGGQAQLSGRQPNTEIADREGVGVPETAHRDHLGGPWTDARQRQQLFSCAVPVAAGVEHQIPVRDRADEGGQ